MKQCQTRGYREVWSWRELLITNSEPPVGCGWCVAHMWLMGLWTKLLSLHITLETFFALLLVDIL